jgi:hypothetical protein
MGTKSDSNGATQGALVVIFGMIMGAMLILVIQRYTTLVKQQVLKEAYDFHKERL